MSVASGNVVHAIRPGEDKFKEGLRILRERGCFVFSPPRLGEEFIVFVGAYRDLENLWACFPYNLGRIVMCKFFDESGRKFVVRTNRMFVGFSDKSGEETLLVELAEEVASPRT
ncbi:MAG: hypothetical protein HYW37_01405 [Candidatus Colwellbacteria bacterium]|nr:hypothetical protein [Candidatus Colwellbacteria bacterium]